MRAWLLGVLAGSILIAAPRSAGARDASFMPAGEQADAPNGFVEMCERDAQACGDTPEGATMKVAGLCAADIGGRAGERCGATGSTSGKGKSTYFTTAALVATRNRPAKTTTEMSFPAGASPVDRTEMQMVKSINRRVNRNVIQRSDLQIYGVDELWRPAGREKGAVGDCEDIALEKQIELAEAGIPADRLRLATAFVRRAGLHTVLIVSLADGDYVLDSLTSSVTRWDRVRYSWLRVQDARDPHVWRRIART